MRALRFAVWIVAWIGAAQSASAQTILTPDSRLSQGAACFSLRCFPTLYGLDENAAVTGNTGPGVAVQTPSGADVWNVEQTLTNPDYNNLPTPNYPWQQFGPAAYRGQALLIGGTSPRYNYKDVVYVYARVGGVWTHLQMLALQRPAGYDRTYIHRIATDGVTAVVSGVRVKDAVDDEAFAQVDLYRRNSDGTFSRRGGFKPPIPADFLWSSSLKVDGNVIALSDPGADEDSGRVLIYGYDAGRGWRLRTTLVSNHRQPGAYFGASIGLDGNTLVVAAPGESDGRPEFGGAVYIYQGAGASWTLQQTLHPIEDPRNTGYQFGDEVDVSGERIIVSKSINDFSENIPYHAYIYERRSSWVPVAELKDNEETNFNEGVRIFGDTAIASGTDWAYGRPTFVFKLPPLGSLPAVEE